MGKYLPTDKVFTVNLAYLTKSHTHGNKKFIKFHCITSMLSFFSEVLLTMPSIYSIFETVTINLGVATCIWSVEILIRRKVHARMYKKKTFGFEIKEEKPQTVFTSRFLFC